MRSRVLQLVLWAVIVPGTSCFPDRSIRSFETPDGGDEPEAGDGGSPSAGTGGMSGSEAGGASGGAADGGDAGAHTAGSGGMSGSGTSGSSGNSSAGKGGMPGIVADAGKKEADGGASGAAGAGMGGASGMSGMGGAGMDGGHGGSGMGGAGDGGRGGSGMGGAGMDGGRGGSGMGGAGMDGGRGASGVAGVAGGGGALCYELSAPQSTKPPQGPPPDAFVASMETRTRDDMTATAVAQYVCVGESGPGKAIFGDLGDGCYMPRPSGTSENDTNVRILTVKSASCLAWQAQSSSQGLPKDAVLLAGVAVCRAHEVAVRTETRNVTSTGDHVGQVQMNVCRYELYGALRSVENYQVLVQAPSTPKN